MRAQGLRYSPASPRGDRQPEVTSPGGQAVRSEGGWCAQPHAPPAMPRFSWGFLAAHSPLSSVFFLLLHHK